MGNTDQVLHLKTEREWHTGKRMDEPRLSTSISNSWIVPFIRAPKSFLWFCTSLGQSLQAESSEPLGSFFFIKILSPTQGSPSKHLLCRMLFATSRFGSKSCTESLSQLPQWKARGCVLPGSKENPATITNGDIRPWHGGEKVMLHTSPSCRCKQTSAPREAAQEEKHGKHKGSFPSPTLSASSTALGANSCILASRQNVRVENLPGFADKRGILGESQFSWMSQVTCVALTQASILPLLTKAVTTQLDLGWTFVALYYVLKEERKFQSHF